MAHTPDVETHLDDWHTHSAAEGVPQEEHGTRVNVLALSIVGVVIVAIVLFFVIAVVVYFGAYSSTLKAEKQENVRWYHEQYGPYAAASERRLAEYGWADSAAGAVRLPIEEAMRRVAQDSN